MSRRTITILPETLLGRLGFLCFLLSVFCAVWLSTFWDSNARSFVWKPSVNELALGSRYGGVQHIILGSTELSELDGKTEQEILDFRTHEVMKHSELLASAYHPYPPLFSGIVDRLPWWGNVGLIRRHFGANPTQEERILGESPTSRILFNPYHFLIGHCYVLPVTDASPEQIERMVKDPKQAFCAPLELVLSPKERQATARYDYSTLKNFFTEVGIELEPEFREPGVGTVTPWRFGVSSINASDFGFEFTTVDWEKTEQVFSLNEDANGVIRNYSQFGHDKRCRPPHGCNSIGPSVESLKKFVVSALPARLTFDLWREYPSDLSRESDLSFTFLLE